MNKTDQLNSDCDKSTPPNRHGSPVEHVLKDGLALIKNAASAEHVEQARIAVIKHFDTTLKRAGGRQGLNVGIEHGYQEIVQRGLGRFDVRLDLGEIPLLQWMTGQTSDQPHWHETITKLLGASPKVVFCGALVAMPDAKIHPWHTDGPHLFDHLGVNRPQHHLPPHCLNIFIPLTRQNDETGRLEICPGSHRLTAGLPSLAHNHVDNKNKLGFEDATRFIECRLGDMIIFDYRLLHRAEPNRSTDLRVTLYATCSTSWFMDTINFPERSLLDRPNAK